MAMSSAAVEKSPLFQERLATGQLVLRDLPKFDLDAYIQPYEGRTRLERLYHIGTASTFLSIPALRLAIQEALTGKDVDLYLTVVDALAKVAPDDPLVEVDTKMVDSRLKELRAEGERLEKELKGYRNNLIKESIRMGNEDLGRHFYQTGELAESWKAFSRMRDYCTNPNHIQSLLFHLVLVAIQQRQWQHALTQVAKLGSTNVKDEEKKEQEPTLKALAGLCFMELGNFHDAARSFMEVNFIYGSQEKLGEHVWHRQVLTPNDVAVYGGLCALAVMDRYDLQSKVLDNPEFRQFLELEPHVRRAITLFCSSKYSACLEILEGYRTDYSLDLYLYPVLQELYSSIRNKCIVQYFIPFSCVTLDEMSKAFQSTSQTSIEDELVHMIDTHQLNARIDLVDRLLVAPESNSRHTIHENAIKAAKAYHDTLRLRLLRLNMISAGLEIRNPNNRGGGGHVQEGDNEDSEMGGMRKGRRGVFS